MHHMYYGGTPIKGFNVHKFEMDTNDCDMIASDLQAGKTAVARGQKIVGTGKSFEFAYYGATETNRTQYIPSDVNVVEIASVDYPIQLAIALNEMEFTDFTSAQVIGYVIVDSTAYEITVQAVDNFLTVSCDKDITLEIFYGKDNYV